MTLLLIIIYIVFIGLGLPDSVLGSAWPAMFPDFNLPVGSQSFLTVLISSGTVLASFFSAKLINKFGTGKITAFSTLLSALSLLGFSISNSIVWLCLLSLPLGFGAGAIDAALNNYVAVHYKAKHMNFLHCFYGVGVSLSPYLMSYALSFDNNWRLGFRIVFFILLAIAIVSFLALPLWNKTTSTPTEQQKELQPQSLSLKQMAKMPKVRIAWIVFFSSVGLEFLCGIWGCTYLVSAENLSESSAAKMITLYYLGITLSRLISGFITSKFSQQKIVAIGYGVVGIALAILFLPLPPIVKGVTLLLIGLGNGPTFPNLAFLTPKFFGKEKSQSIMGTILASCNIGILLVPPMFSVLAQYVGLQTFPLVLALIYIVMAVSTIFYLKPIKRTNFTLPLA